ncbi:MULTISPECIES: hypothetical protein [unclassified Microcoleus]|uniref:hypothetical protein n=1 Tax=unclassified Microcoleus TaxID=2642155 RepID=UPI002FD19259
MTIATTDRPKLTTQMGRKEAEQITNDIRANFDSLGKMLLEVRERKGFLALGYQSLESYCLTEFGKGKARVYQLIEEAKIEEGITAELAASDSPIKSLKMPGTYLRELKVLETPRQQIEAIAYANKLANNEGKTKATITHLQAAINKLNPKKVEQTKQILKTIGFDKGAEVEVLEGRAKGERGVIRKIDKKGVHVEFYSGNSMPIAWDVSELKVVPAEERPKRPAMMDTISIGDTVQIFSSNNNKGKTGEIVARINDKQALVLVEGGRKSEIPYAELERIEIVNETQAQATDLIWAGIWNPLSSWYYNAKANEIHSFGCPDLIFQPQAKCPSPSDWLEKWRQKNIAAIADALLTKDDLAALVVATTSKMSPEQKEAFWGKINVSKSHSEAVGLRIENSELRAQLLEAEAAIQSIVDALETSSPGDTAAQRDFLLENTSEISSPGDTAAQTDFLLENTSEISSPGDTAAQTDSWKQLLANNGFTPVPYELEGSYKGHWRGWKLFFHAPNGGVTAIDIANEKEEMFARCTEVDFDINLDNEEAIIDWTKGIINQVEDFCPGQLSLFSEEFSPLENILDQPNQNWHIDWLNKNFPVPPKIAHDKSKDSLVGKIQESLEQLLEKADNLVKTLDVKSPNSNKTKRESRLIKEREIKNVRQSIKNLELFQHLQIGMLVNHHRDAQKIGVIANLTMSVGGMPEVWVKWDADSIETSESVHLLQFLKTDEDES